MIGPEIRVKIRVKEEKKQQKSQKWSTKSTIQDVKCLNLFANFEMRESCPKQVFWINTFCKK